MIGQNIKYFRKLKGLSQGELARAIGHKSSAYISFLEDGRRRCNAEDLWKISEALGTPIETLYSKEPVSDILVITLKPGQMVKVDGFPLTLPTATKAIIHRGSYDLIKTHLL